MFIEEDFYRTFFLLNPNYNSKKNPKQTQIYTCMLKTTPPKLNIVRLNMETSLVSSFMCSTGLQTANTVTVGEHTNVLMFRSLLLVSRSLSATRNLVTVTGLHSYNIPTHLSFQTWTPIKT